MALSTLLTVLMVDSSSVTAGKVRQHGQRHSSRQVGKGVAKLSCMAVLLTDLRAPAVLKWAGKWASISTSTPQGHRPACLPAHLLL